MRSSQLTAGEAARSLQEVARLFADEIEHIPSSKPYREGFIQDAKAWVACLNEVVRFLADEGETPVRGHDEWLYEIDTAVLLLDKVTDARECECNQVVDCLLLPINAMIKDVVSYANIKLLVPVDLPNTINQDGLIEPRVQETIH